MRVNSGGNTAQGNEASGAKQSGRAAPAHEAKEKGSTSAVEKKSQSGVNAEISAKSKEFAQAKAIATDAPDVRDERIAELKKRIADGSYKVDSEAVAGRLVDDHLKMSGMG